MTKHLRYALIAAATLLTLGIFGLGDDAGEEMFDAYMTDGYADEGYAEAGYGYGGPAAPGYGAEAAGGGYPAGPDSRPADVYHPAQAYPANAGLAASGPGGAFEPTGQPGFVRYIEPNEQAFSVMIPASWRMQTQIDRSSGYGAQTWKTLASPDGQVVLRSPDMPPIFFASPNPQMGMHEGTQVGSMQVRSYRQGRAYAAEHTQRVAQALGCGSMQPSPPRARADLEARLHQFKPQGTDQLVRRFSTGEAEARCQRGGQALILIVHATTVELHSGGWYPSTSSIVAPAERADEARQAMEQFAQTFTPNMQWANREAQVGQRRLAEEARARSRSAGRGNYAGGYTGSSGSSSSTWSGSSSDASHQAFINSIHGTQDLTDQFGDTVWGVESNSTYHWQDNQGNIVGTDIDENPNPLEYSRMTSGGNN